MDLFFCTGVVDYQWIYNEISFQKERTGERIKYKSEQMKSNIHLFRVEGMTCNHCKANVENGLKGLRRLLKYWLIPERIWSPTGWIITDDQIKETIEKLGYSFKEGSDFHDVE